MTFIVQTVLSKLGSDRSRGETRLQLHPHLTSTLGTSIPRRVRVHAVHFHVAGTRRAPEAQPGSKGGAGIAGWRARPGRAWCQVKSSQVHCYMYPREYIR